MNARLNPAAWPKKIQLTLLAGVAAVQMASACGVKGPPLPPLAVTGEQSERLESALKADPNPSPSPGKKE